MKAVIGVVIGLLAFVFVFAQSKQNPALARGKKVYLKTCNSCHLKDGKGVVKINPPLSKSEFVTGDKERLIRIVLRGLSDPIKVNGVEYNAAMPGFESLSDKEVSDLLTYVRNSFGNKASTITIKDVQVVRDKING